MVFLIQILLLAVLALVILQIVKMIRGDRVDAGQITDRAAGNRQFGDAGTPGANAASALDDFEQVRESLRAQYPLLFSMLGGYLNAHSISEAGSLEAAVSEMISEWSQRRDGISNELVRLLDDNPDEGACRAIVIAACEASFDQEGYRSWLAWLLGQFSERR